MLLSLVLEKTLENPLDYKEIKPVNSKGNQSWIFIRRSDAEAEVPILGPPDMRNQVSGKDPDAGKDWRQEKGVTEDEMVGWHHWLNGCKFEQALGDGEGQGSLACRKPMQSMGLQRVRHNWATEQQQQSFDVLEYLPFVAKLLYNLAPPLTSCEQFLRAIWNAASGAAVLVLPQIKLNLQLSHRVTIFIFNTFTLSNGQAFHVE